MSTSYIQMSAFVITERGMYNSFRTGVYNACYKIWQFKKIGKNSDSVRISISWLIKLNAGKARDGRIGVCHHG